LPPDLGGVPAFGIGPAHGAGIAQDEDFHVVPVGCKSVNAPCAV
jgi:hypothetical protein